MVTSKLMQAIMEIARDLKMVDTGKSTEIFSERNSALRLQTFIRFPVVLHCF